MPAEKPAVDVMTGLAAERTLLAWVRTALAMMGFGFVVARFGLFLQQIAAVEHAPRPSGLSIWIGGSLIVLGVLTGLLAAANHVRLLRQLARGEVYRVSEFSLGVVVTLLLAGVGVVMTVYLIFWQS